MSTTGQQVGADSVAPLATAWQELLSAFATAGEMLEGVERAVRPLVLLDRIRKFIDQEVQRAMEAYTSRKDIPRRYGEGCREDIQARFWGLNVVYWQNRLRAEAKSTRPKVMLGDRHTPMVRESLAAHEQLVAACRRVTKLAVRASGRGGHIQLPAGGGTDPLYRERGTPEAEKELYQALLDAAEHFSRTTTSPTRNHKTLVAESREACACFERAIRLAEQHTAEVDGAMAKRMPGQSLQCNVFPRQKSLTSAFLQWPHIVLALCKYGFCSLREPDRRPEDMLRKAEDLQSRADAVLQKYHDVYLQLRMSCTNMSASNKEKLQLGHDHIHRFLDSGATSETNKALLKSLKRLCTERLCRGE